MSVRPFGPDEARDLLESISDASAKKEGRRFIVTIQRRDGGEDSGMICSTREDRLEMNDVSTPEVRGWSVEWDDIESVMIRAE